MSDQEGGQPEHEGRFPPRHRQQKVPGGREQQGRDQPSAFPRDGVRQRRARQQHRCQRLHSGLQRELAGEFGAGRHPQRCDDEEGAVTGADDRGGRPEPPGSRVCVRCPHVRCRGEARQPKTPRRHPAEGTGGGSVSVDNRWRCRGVPATVPRLAAPAGSSRRAHRGAHHRRTCGPDPDPGVPAADGRRGRAAGGRLPARWRMVGRRPRHLRRRCAQPRGRGGRGSGVGRLPTGARTPPTRRGRRCLGRNTMGGGARWRAWRRPRHRLGPSRATRPAPAADGSAAHGAWVGATGTRRLCRHRRAPRT